MVVVTCFTCDTIQSAFKDDRYKIIHKLGKEESSIVWLAKDKELNQWVSLKIVRAEFSQDSQFATIEKAFSKTNLKIYCSITRLLYSPRT